MPWQDVYSIEELTSNPDYRLANNQVGVIHVHQIIRIPNLVNNYKSTCYNLPSCRVQELASDDRREAGRIPRTVECELTADLVDSCVPGDMVTITAIVKATGSEEGETQ